MLSRKNIILLSIIFVVFFCIIEEVQARPPFKLFMFTSYDVSVSDSENVDQFPAIYWTYMQILDEQNTYIDYSLQNSTQLGVELGQFNSIYSIGVRPHVAYKIYGADKTLENGKNIEERTFEAHYAGIEFSGKYKLNRTMTTWYKYMPRYHFYSEYDKTEIPLPSKHWEHSILFFTTISDVTAKNIGRVKNGYHSKFSIELIKRFGYGTFEDLPGYEKSTINFTQKLHCEFGLYYTFAENFDIQLDITGMYQHDVDRNNSDYIGSFFGDNKLPGFCNKEFMHDRFVTGSLKLGIPVLFWETRINPGFNVLYMPSNNKVKAVQDYPHQLYVSVSLSASMKFANTLPLFLSYAYGINADRPGDYGNHEMAVSTIFAFGLMQ